MSVSVGYRQPRRSRLSEALEALRRNGVNARGGDRRAEVPRMTLAQLAALYGVSPSTLARARRLMLAGADR